LDDPAGITTRFSINNASETAALAHVTVWSDLGIPVLVFDVYLTGYDVQRIDLPEILLGRLPRTADPSSDPDDSISPKGPLTFEVVFPNCGNTLPPASLDA